MVAPSFAEQLGCMEWQIDDWRGLTDSNIAVRTLQHLVHAFGTKGRTHDACDGLCRQDIGLLGLETFDSVLGLLFLRRDRNALVGRAEIGYEENLKNNEGPAILVESERHMDWRPDDGAGRLFGLS